MTLNFQEGQRSFTLLWKRVETLLIYILVGTYVTGAATIHGISKYMAKIDFVQF